MMFNIILFTSWFVNLACAVESENMATMPERLIDDELAEKVFESFYFLEENRKENKCLPEGAQCKFSSKLKCCGVDTRCVFKDTQLPPERKGGSIVWISKCRKFKFGVIVKKLG